MAGLLLPRPEPKLLSVVRRSQSALSAGLLGGGSTIRGVDRHPEALSS